MYFRAGAASVALLIWMMALTIRLPNEGRAALLSMGVLVLWAMVSVGSTNFDMRSFELNDEASLNVYSERFAADMSQVFERDLASANPYSFEQWQHRPWTQKLAERVLIPIRSQL